LVEQGPFKALVLGSSPSRPTIIINILRDCPDRERFDTVLRHGLFEESQRDTVLLSARL
jgi:hypothetical protein